MKAKNESSYRKTLLMFLFLKKPHTGYFPNWEEIVLDKWIILGINCNYNILA